MGHTPGDLPPHCAVNLPDSYSSLISAPDYEILPDIDQHEGGVNVWDAANRTGTAMNLPIHPFTDAIGTDASPVFAEKTAVNQRFLNAIFHLLCCFFQLMERKSSTTVRSQAAFLLSSAWIALSNLGHQLHFGARRHHKQIAVKMDHTPLVFAPGNTSSTSSSIPDTCPHNKFDFIQIATAQPWKRCPSWPCPSSYPLCSLQNLTVSVLIHHN